MGNGGEDVLKGRGKTNVSLGAERAGLDDSIDRATVNERRLLDDLIERDRLLADMRLLKFRESADQVLARAQMAAPPADGDVTEARRAADETKDAEREATDNLLTRERQRVDARADARRREQDLDCTSRATHRKTTDARLSDERCVADVTSAALAQTKIGLATSQRALASRLDVLATVTHDLRNPLSVIMANAELIAHCTAEGDTRELADDIVLAGARMNRILEDLLDVARVESGTLHVDEKSHDLGALLYETLRSYQPLFAARGLTFTADLPEVPGVATFDHDRIVQILSNLLSNAMKFTPPPGTVELRVVREADEVVFVLSDSGLGIHPDVLPHVFERFWQSDADTRRGLGLGLFICRELAQAHGGSISVESRLGEGSTFRLSLPGG